MTINLQNPCKKCGGTSPNNRGRCVACVKASLKAWRDANKEKEKTSAAAYRALNRDRRNAQSIEWAKNNPDKARAAASAWQAANPDKIKGYRVDFYKRHSEKIKSNTAEWRVANKEKASAACAAWYAANKDLAAARNSEWKKANPLAVKAHHQNRRARKKSVGGRLSSDLALRLFALQKGMCPCCKKPLGDDYHMDHIQPLALGGANEDWNIQLLRQRCNNQKQAKHPVDFMQSRGFLL